MNAEIQIHDAQGTLQQLSSEVDNAETKKARVAKARELRDYLKFIGDSILEDAKES